MTRNIPAAAPTVPATNEGHRRAHLALDELLDRADLHRSTGRGQITIDFNEGGIRAVKIGIEEIFKN